MAIGSAAGLTMPTAPELPNYREDRRIAVGVCIFLTLLIWLVFGQTLNHEFINFDDDRYVYQNAEIIKGVTVEGLKWFLTHSHAQLWHPLTTLSHMIDCQIYGLRPGGHHFTNVVLHNIASVLLFLALCRMTGYVWRSAFVAAIFAIHPLRVESVAWIAERKDILSGVFFALTLAAYVYYARAPGVRRYFVLLIPIVCGLMSKATFVTVPIVLLLLDYWPLRRWQRHGARSQEVRRQVSWSVVGGRQSGCRKDPSHRTFAYRRGDHDSRPNADDCVTRTIRPAPAHQKRGREHCYLSAPNVLAVWSRRFLSPSSGPFECLDRFRIRGADPGDHPGCDFADPAAALSFCRLVLVSDTPFSGARFFSIGPAGQG